MLPCPCSPPKLTPLQSRFLASAAALAVLFLIYWSLSDAHFAYAAELPIDGSGSSRIDGDDHNWHRIADEQLEADGVVVDMEVSPTPVLELRAATTSTTAGNNQPNVNNILPGDTNVWLFTSDQLASRGTDAGLEHMELRKRNSEADAERSNDLEIRQSTTTSTIFVSINTCVQPAYNGSTVQEAPPPQLTLYVATSGSNTSPGPNADASEQAVIELDEGFANYTTTATGDWYVAVHAPALPNNFQNVWNYELAVSVDGYYHSLGTNGTNLYLIDSDSNAALLVTNNLTQADPSSETYQHWLDATPPYIVFASNVNHSSTMGISKSYCGLSQNSQIKGNLDDLTGDNTNVQMEMITRGLGNKPKEQFYITYLNGSSHYQAVLAEPSNSGAGSVGGGGKVWDAMSFPTKSDGNCALLYNLDFCDQVAYAVPSSPSFASNFTNLQSFYNNYTLFWYQQFNYTLQQIPCLTDSASQYSLATNCSQCASAYKQWLCAVSIPRCEDFSNDAPYLQVRNVGQPFINGSMLHSDFLSSNFVPMSNAPTLQGSMAFQQTYLSSVATNQSRNPSIDSTIAPGPYKEVLPCEDLCYSLVQSCPASMGFGCPHPGRGLEVGYGTRAGLKDGILTCSYLGAYVYTDAAFGMSANVLRVCMFAAMAVVWLMV